jgi:hypothetical protein
MCCHLPCLLEVTGKEQREAGGVETSAIINRKHAVDRREEAGWIEAKAISDWLNAPRRFRYIGISFSYNIGISKAAT